jgi:hypothetical protein
MYALTFISPYTIYKVDDYPSIEDCERDCEARYKTRGIKFKLSDDGTWRAVVAAEEGAIVLRLVEIREGQE